MLIKIADIIGGTKRICKFLPKIDRLKRKKGKMKTYFYSYFMAKDPFEEYIRHVDARKKRRVSHGRAQWVFARCWWIKAFEILRNLLLGE